VQAAREAGRRAQCMNNLKQIGLGIQQYQDAQRAFPPGAISHWACRYHGFNYVYWILPYMDGAPEYATLSKGYSDPEGGNISLNWTLRELFSGRSIPWGICPSSPLPAWTDPIPAPPEGPYTPNLAVFQMLDYSAVTGSYESRHKKIWNNDGTQRVGLSGLLPVGLFQDPANPQPYCKIFVNMSTIGGDVRGRYGVRLREVTDGLSKTLAVVETSGFLINNSGGTSWGRMVTQSHGSVVQGPCCWDWQPDSPKGTTSINNGVGEISWEVYKVKMGMPINSGHGPAGMVVMGDGSVHFFHEEMDLQLLYSLGDRDDGAVLPSNVIP
jgi:hypothetical protein